MIIAVDFDGTICENGHWPEIGALIPGAANALRILHSRGHKIVINSCRCGASERLMVLFLVANHIPFDAVNENLPERIAAFGGDCRKISADLYIDDKGLGCSICWPDIVEEIKRMEAAE